MRALLWVLAVWLCACSATAVQRQVISADVSARAINRALPVVVQEYERAGREVLRTACRTDVPDGCTNAVLHEARAGHERRWRPVMVAWEATRIAHSRWRLALEACRAHLADAGTEDAGACSVSLGDLATAAMAAANEMRCALRAIDVSLDLLPGALTCDRDGGAP